MCKRYSPHLNRFPWFYRKHQLYFVIELCIVHGQSPATPGLEETQEHLRSSPVDWFYRVYLRRVPDDFPLIYRDCVTS